MHKANYDSVNENSNSNKKGLAHLLLKFRNVVFIFIVTGIIVAFMLVKGSLGVYCPLTLFIGFFLGGTFNNISSH